MNHPNYVSNSNLSLAYAKQDNSINVIVNIDDYRNQIKRNLSHTR